MKSYEEGPSYSTDSTSVPKETWCLDWNNPRETLVCCGQLCCATNGVLFSRLDIPMMPRWIYTSELTSVAPSAQSSSAFLRIL